MKNIPDKTLQSEQAEVLQELLHRVNDCLLPSPRAFYSMLPQTRAQNPLLYDQVL